MEIPPRYGNAKREEFRKYLEKTGVLEMLTKVLVSLYEQPERPADALEDNLVLVKDGLENTDMKIELEDLKKKVETLELENAQLKSKLERYESVEKHGET